jgi:hypothetical protein
VTDAIFKYVVDLSLLQSVQRDLLVRVLLPFAPHLARLGLALDSASRAPSWIQHLHQILNREDGSLPARLQAAFVEVTDLTSELGHELIVAVALERKIDLFPSGRSIARQDLPFHVYLFHPDLFRAAHARLRSFPATMFVEYYGRGVGPAVEHSVASKLDVLRERLRASFSARNRGDFCGVMLEQLAGQFVFIFARGSAPLRSVSIRARKSISTPTWIPQQHDVVIYETAADRLSVSAVHATDRELYRATLGFVLALDEQYFRTYSVFDGAPMKKRGSAALDSSDIVGLERVVLRKITILPLDRRGEQVEFVADDLSQSLDGGRLHTFLQHRAIGAWTFGLFLSDNRKALEIDILPPNALRFDRRLPLPIFRDFMELRGFYRPPPRGT